MFRYKKSADISVYKDYMESYQRSIIYRSALVQHSQTKWYAVTLKRAEMIQLLTFKCACAHASVRGWTRAYSREFERLLFQEKGCHILIILELFPVMASRGIVFQPKFRVSPYSLAYLRHIHHIMQPNREGAY